METTITSSAVKPTSKGSLVAGWIITGLCTLFLLFDAISKIFQESHTISASQKMGWPVAALQPQGVVLLVCTILYLVRRTSVLGAVLLTAYLGGATAEMVRAGMGLYFPVVFGILVWLGIYLRDEQLRTIVPLKKA